ncbi:signal peptidase I [Streptomyces sp. P38-E01]|uniref:Signal peptidase I n=1 Tax=Streptomyces tardus TaxID=2780544 RepID=A0A949N2T4_9ACTN|nr:signal peptidase I [Streptomyces tardus]MBU7596134.1 signal peptidase I [Streptomyces tardus]
MSTDTEERAGRQARTGHAISSVAVALGCVLFLGGFAWGAYQYQPYTVPTDSMTPTVSAGERVLAQRIDGSEVRRGDVVVFEDPQWGDMPMLKRVVGVGGDKVVCCDGQGRLTVNGTPVEEPYRSGGKRASPTDFSATVPSGRLFLLGDKRDSSLDSREHLEDSAEGAVRRDTVRARVDATVWPMGDAGKVGRPPAFTELPGGVSAPGPLEPVLWTSGVGVVLILAGAAYGPFARRGGRQAAP